jgi:hypothetical protein
MRCAVRGTRPAGPAFGATLVAIEVRQEGSMVTVRVEDDGMGGADATGGGPAVIEAEPPCV